MPAKTVRSVRPEPSAPSAALDLTGLLLTLAAEVGAARPRAWGDSVAQTLRLIALRLPPRANREFQLAEARKIAGVELRLVSPATNRRFPPWICRDDPPPWLLESGSGVFTPDLHVACFRGGTLVQFGTVPVVIAGDRRTLARDASGRYAALLHYANFDLATAVDGAREVSGKVFLLSDDIWPANYSHWLLDALPRLAALELAGWSGADVMLATSPLTQPYQWETLRSCGWTADRIIEVAPGHALRARELLVTTDQPAPPHPMFKGAPWAARHLRRRLGVAASNGPADPATGRRLFLSRADAGWRLVLNAPELMAALAGRGFESVSPGGMTVRKQAELFDSAAWIVAPHGAGLANLVFCRPGTTVLEIFPYSFGTTAFYCVAAAGRLRYGCHIVPESDVVRRDGVGYDDFRVDPERLFHSYADLLPEG